MTDDQITVILSATVTRLVREEIERQRRKGRTPQTPEQIVEQGTAFVCEAMAVSDEALLAMASSPSKAFLASQPLPNRKTPDKDYGYRPPGES
jgi:hypothetical protein